MQLSSAYDLHGIEIRHSAAVCEEGRRELNASTKLLGVCKKVEGKFSL